MTVIAMGLGYAISIGDPTILSANLQVVSSGLQISGSTSTFVASLATLTMAAAVLSAGALGDLYGMRRMYLVGLSGAIAFSALAAAAPTPAVLMVARAGVGVALAFLIGLSLGDHQRGVPAGSTGRGDRGLLRRGIRRRHPAARTRWRAGACHRLARMLFRRAGHRCVGVGRHLAVRARDDARRPPPGCARLGAVRRRAAGADLRHLADGDGRRPRRPGVHRGRPGGRLRVRDAGAAHAGSGAGYAGLPLEPVQRGRDGRGDVQHRARRVDGPAGVLLGDHPQGIPRAVRLPADSCHRDGGTGGLLAPARPRTGSAPAPCSSAGSS